MNKSADPELKIGFVSLVGAGPGDPGLITVAGARRLREADVVIYDRLASEDLLRLARADAVRIYVGKASGRHTLTQEEINALLVEHGAQGKRVCRLKGGDPFVFGRGGEEALACVNAGIPFEVIPGVTSSIAVPAYAGIPVTHRQVAASFSVITGHEDPARGSSPIRWKELATATDTLVFLMGVERLDEIVQQLLDNGRPASTPAAIVQRGTLADQRVVTGELGSIAQAARDADIRPPAITIVGDVVRLRESIQWYRPSVLAGRRILVTRARTQASELSHLLSELGAEVIEIPTISVRPFRAEDQPALPRIMETPWDWVLFTSVNAVTSFFSLVRGAGGDVRSIGRARIAAVGPITAKALDDIGLRVDFMPAEAVASRLASDFPESLTGRSVLLPRALVAPEDLPEALASAGARVTVFPVYRTVQAEDSAARIQEILQEGEVDVITFTSSSTVQSFLLAVPVSQVPPEVKIACIGPVTARTATEAGLSVSAVADEHTIPGLVAAIRKMCEPAAP